MIPRRPEWWLHYVGKPYRFRGTDLAAGIDCFQLDRLVKRVEFGLEIDDFGWAYADGDAKAGVKAGRAVIQDQMPGWKKAPWEEGASVLFNVCGHPVHLATATSTPGIVLHAHRRTGVDTLNINTSLTWKGRFVGCFLPA